jgi:hypothetical protein
MPLLRPAGTRKNLRYDPKVDRHPEVELTDGRQVQARPSYLYIHDGVVWPQLHTRTPMQRILECPLHDAASR